ncbi:MAG: YigZ family protein [Synergistaceae bacterium]|nr:YigZ family protein [Synergistaceae bacterium]
MLGTNLYNEPEKSITYEEKIKRSVFIANLEICHDELEAKNFLNKIISQHRDATHNCRAYIFADKSEYFSDDGEPSGTAGRPILNSIKKSNLVNVMVIVTRYFGGVKLGVRGLIDAYGGVSEKALDMAGKIQRIITSKIQISLEYNSMGLITRLLENFNAINLFWDYKEFVNVIADIQIDKLENISLELNELKSRKIIINWENLS